VDIGTKETWLILLQSGDLLMLCSRPPRPIRTTLDLANAEQVKSVRKRLRITRADLVRIVDKTGNSLSAIEKEVEFENLTAAQPCNAKNGPETFK
jgi:DNA-binding XRE family transcriptional regulator